MEDSRNIIKAIDALTLKAGGEVVDSKNITEAIDRLKEVYSQEAIGIDDTLTQEGLAADAKAVGNRLGGLSYKTVCQIASNSEVALRLQKNSRMVLYVTANGSGSMTEYIISSSSSSIVYVQKIYNAQYVGESASEDTLRLSNSATGSLTIHALIFSGGISVVE